MPVILHERNEETWVDPNFNDVSKLLPFLAHYPHDEMEAYEVSRLVNSPKNDRPECTVPIGQSGDSP